MTDTREFAEERWAFAGRRLDRAGKICYAWQPLNPDLSLNGDAVTYDKMKAQVVGGIYLVQVSRDDEEHLWAKSSVKFSGEFDLDADRVAIWRALDLKAWSDKQAVLSEKRLASDTSLDRALAPLIKIAAEAKTFEELDALVHITTKALRKAWH